MGKAIVALARVESFEAGGGGGGGGNREKTGSTVHNAENFRLG